MCVSERVNRYIYACVYVYVYVCTYMHVCMYVYSYLCIDCESQYQCFCVLGCVMDAHVCSCAYVCTCICVYVYMYVPFFAVTVACTFEQVFWAPVHVQVDTLHRCFLTSTYTSATHSLQGVHICVCIFICICM